MVTNISHSQIAGALVRYQSSSLDVSRTATSNQNGERILTADSVSLRSESILTVTYSGNMGLPDGDEVRFGMLRQLVADLLSEQGLDTKIAVGDQEIDLAAVAPEEARELVSDEGSFGVQQTSDRIFQFAVGVAGGDASRIDAIKRGIDKGFADAKKAFGDWLPDISYDTYDAVMQKLDDWAIGQREMV
jgi:hypothetical protein